MTQVEPANGSMVNRIGKVIPKQRMTDRYIGRRTRDYLAPLNWRLLLSDRRISEIHGGDNGLAELYRRCLRECPIRYTEKIMQKVKGLFVSGLQDTREKILFGDAIAMAKGILAGAGFDKEETVDRLVFMLYSEHRNTNRELLWACYGDILLANLRRNLSAGNSVKNGSENVCGSCGKFYIYDKASGCSKLMCPECYKKARRAYKTEKQREYRRGFENPDD